MQVYDAASDGVVGHLRGRVQQICDQSQKLMSLHAKAVDRLLSQQTTSSKFSLPSPHFVRKSVKTTA